jgi:hypothetical protein
MKRCFAELHNSLSELAFRAGNSVGFTMVNVEQYDGYSVQRMGREREPLVVIDDFFADPSLLVNDASKKTFSASPNGYPGLRANAPSQYLLEKGELLSKILALVFGYTRRADLMECNYSLVTTHPEHLHPVQRMPHYDGCDEYRIALLHYLCGPEKGGTSHYRHVSTGFETVRTHRRDTYLEALNAEEKQDGPPPASYFDGTHPRFETIARTEAKFNRVIMYRGTMIHSGDIPKDFSFAEDAIDGRLTVNSLFVQG